MASFTKRTENRRRHKIEKKHVNRLKGLRRATLRASKKAAAAA